MKQSASSPKGLVLKRYVPAACAFIFLFFGILVPRTPIDNWLYGRVLQHKARSERFRFETSPNIVSVVLTDNVDREYESVVSSRKIFLDALKVGQLCEAAGGGFDFLFRKNQNLAVDERLAETCAEMPGFVLPVAPQTADNVSEGEKENLDWEKAVLHKHALHPKIIGRNRIPVAERFIVSAQNFSEAASIIGHVGVELDRDGVYRKLPLLYRYGQDDYVPAYSFALALNYLGADKDNIVVDLRKGEVRVPLADGELVVPVNHRGYIMIPYNGEWMSKDVIELDKFEKAYSYLAYEGYVDDPDFDIESYNGSPEDAELLGDIRAMVEGNLMMFGDLVWYNKDFGPTPLEGDCPLMDIHSSILNGMLTNSFVREISGRMKLLYFVIMLALIIAGISIRKSNLFNSYFALLSVLLLAFTMLLGVVFGYAPCFFVVFLAVFFAWAISFAARQLAVHKEKSFITGAFSQCLSKDVVDGIVKNPSSLKLGGISREMTAIFTDIQKFSGFSELLNAAELVALLNYYLTRMSDIIMSEHGTVDKYEGDAIVALVGAPLEMSDHASRACAAAIKMKKAEVLMNKEMYDIAAKGENDGSIDDELFSAFKKLTAREIRIFTRIGINSGEMVAGFMGSEKKKNYTMMGNNVNLASRLEGVNKQYSTGGMMISEATRSLIGDGFVVRSLDRVQVVNVKTPIRLYELLETKADAPEELVRYVQDWEDALKTFEGGDCKKALEMFKGCSALRPDDKVAKYYISLLETFFAKGKYPTEADDFGVAYNAENPADMDPSWIGTKNEIRGTFKLLQK